MGNTWIALISRFFGLGICAPVEAVRQQGLLTADEVDQMRNRAAQDIAGETELTERLAGGGNDHPTLIHSLQTRIEA